MTTDTITPYAMNIPAPELEDLKSRLRMARWPDEVPNLGWDYGVPLGYIQDLAEYRRDGCDWELHAARLNEHPQLITTIDGQPVHFLDVRSPERGALPLICTHGWPMSVFEYLDLIGPSAIRERHGADPTDAFDLVNPLRPGSGLLGPDYRARMEYQPTRARLGDPDAAARLRAVRRPRQRHRLPGLTGGRQARP